jgi:serine/threonine-protein kinase
MFCDEARICAALSHPNIVQVVDFGEHDGELFMAMEYVEGVSLARLLRAVAARGQRSPSARPSPSRPRCCGAALAHEARDERGRPLNIVHRDVSPGNILIGRRGRSSSRTSASSSAPSWTGGPTPASSRARWGTCPPSR